MHCFSVISKNIIVNHTLLNITLLMLHVCLTLTTVTGLAQKLLTLKK